MTSLQAVAIDGPAGSGKSTVARAVAERLGYLYVDTGAMYRAVALAASRAGVDLEDEEAMGRVADGSELAFDASGTRILLNGEDVSDAIRTPKVTAITRFAARAAPVREVLVARQREMAAERPVVMEGRDITTVVLDQARHKVFLMADPAERARRRQLEMKAKGHDVDFDDLLRQVEERDASDNAVGPMKQARENALDPNEPTVLLDTTGLSADEVIARIVTHVQQEEDARGN